MSLRGTRIIVLFSILLEIFVIGWCAVYLGIDLRDNDISGMWFNTFFIVLNMIPLRLNVRNYRNLRRAEREADRWPK